ncbi:hypothetical protein FKW77_000983 [Venturia effusa]|uniref:Uncharacterized protein n=1 Tax=Venturia effusa TaxID=50376 RepID=A0A517LQJ2_9PEZI|nr:hypothetical protein FKW77_000983 [Venturia effusa]
MRLPYLVAAIWSAVWTQAHPSADFELIPRQRFRPRPAPAPKPYEEPAAPGRRPSPHHQLPGSTGPGSRTDVTKPDHHGLGLDEFNNVLDIVAAIVSGASESEYTATEMTVVDIHSIPATTRTWTSTTGCTSVDKSPYSCPYHAPIFTSFVPKRTERSSVTEEVLKPKTRPSGAKYVTMTTTATKANVTRTYAIIAAYTTYNSTTMSVPPPAPSLGCTRISLALSPFAAMIAVALGFVVLM